METGGEAVMGVAGGVLVDEPLPLIQDLNLNIAELVSGKSTPKRKVTPKKEKLQQEEMQIDGEEEEEDDEEFIVATKSKRPRRTVRKALPLAKMIMLILGADDGDLDTQKGKAISLGAKCLKRKGKSLTHVLWNEGGSLKTLASCHAAGLTCVLSSWLDACEQAKQCVAVDEYLVPQVTLDQATTESADKKRKTPSKVQVVPRDDEGAVVLPVILGDITLLDLGVVRPQQGFFSTTTLFPVGYKMQGKRRSYVHPTVEVPYTFEIGEASVDAIDSAPVFKITCPHDPEEPAVADSIEGACNIVLSRLAGGEEITPLTEEEAADWFGLTNVTVRYLLQDLPNVDQCDGFVPQQLKKKKRAKVSVAERSAIKNRKAKEKEEKEAERAAAKEKREADKAAREADKLHKAAERAAKKEENDKKKAERDKKRAAKAKKKAEAEAKKAKQAAMMSSFFGSPKAAPLVKVKDIVAPILPERDAAFNTEAFDSLLQPQSGSLEDCLAQLKAKKCHLKKQARVPREKFLKHHDDFYRPLFSVLWRGDALQLSKVNGRKPFIQHEEIEYDYDSDEDWENWNQAEIIDEEDLEDMEDDEPMEGDEKLAEGEENFIVPDNLVIMDDDSVKRGLHVKPQGDSKHKELQLVAHFHSCSSGGAPLPELAQLTVAPVALPLFDVFPIDVDKVTPQIPRKRKKAVSTPAASSAGAAASSSSSKKRGKKFVAVDVEALKRVLQANTGAGLDKLVSAFQALPEGGNTSKKSVKEAIKTVAVKKGKTWTLTENATTSEKPTEKETVEAE